VTIRRTDGVGFDNSGVRVPHPTDM